MSEWTAGRLADAREAAERLARTEDGRVDGLDILASIHRQADRRDDAVAAARAILQVDPELSATSPARPTSGWSSARI